MTFNFSWKTASLIITCTDIRCEFDFYFGSINTACLTKIYIITKICEFNLMNLAFFSISKRNAFLTSQLCHIQYLIFDAPWWSIACSIIIAVTNHSPSGAVFGVKFILVFVFCPRNLSQSNCFAYSCLRRIYWKWRSVVSIVLIFINKQWKFPRTGTACFS